MNRDEKRLAVLRSAAQEVEERETAGRQVFLTVALAKTVNKFLSRHNVEMELAALVLDGLTEELCVAVYDEAAAGNRVQAVIQ